MGLGFRGHGIRSLFLFIVFMQWNIQWSMQESFCNGGINYVTRGFKVAMGLFS